MVDLIFALATALVGSFGSLVLVAVISGFLHQDQSVGLEMSTPDLVERTSTNPSNSPGRPSSTVGVSPFNPPTDPTETTRVYVSAPR